MLLTIDVGNTNITFGVFDRKKLVTTFRMTTKQLRTSDEYGVNRTKSVIWNGYPGCDHCIGCAGCYAFADQCDS